MIYGYARVSTKEQLLNRQLDSIQQYKKVDRLFTDKKTGTTIDRPAYKELKSIIKSGDELIIHSLDRLGRNKSIIKEELKWFNDHNIIVRILNMPTTLLDMNGQEWILDMINNIIIEVLSSIAEQEREELVIRTKEGIESAKKRGVTLGRPKVDIDDDLIRFYSKQISNNGITVTEVADKLNISRSTWYKLKKSVS